MNETNKKIILQNKIQNKKQWELELESQTKQLEGIKKIIDIFAEQRKLQAESAKIVFDNYELTKPNWKFETLPEYMAKQKRLQELAQVTKEMEYDALVSSRDADYKKIMSQHEELKKALDNLNKDIEELNLKGE